MSFYLSAFLSFQFVSSCNSTQTNWFLLSMTNATREYCIGNLLILSHLYLVEWYIWYKMPLLIYILTYLPTYLLNINLGKLFKWGNYSSEETIQGRKLFKGGNYIYGNFWHFDITHKLFQSTSIDVFTTQNLEILAKILKKALYFMVICLEIFFWIQMMQFSWPNQI